MSKILLALITAFLLLGAARAAEEFELAIPTLKEGSDAPALKVSKWVKGGPVVLADGKGKQIHIVEFWATWCPPCVRSIPHLTKISQRFGKSGVTVVGISIDGEGTREKVEPFVKNMGPKMDYNVALDDADAMKKAYLDAAEAQGIPHAFIVGKDGRIAWQGHPMDGLDLKIAELVGDKDYAEGAKKEKELQENLQNAAEGEDWAKALAAMDGLLTLHPEDTDLLVGKYRVLTLQKAAQPAAAWGREILKRVTDIEPLNGMAWMILTEEEFTEGRDLELAMAVVKKANELSEGKNWSVLDTLARALFETKSPAEAVKIQEKAIGLAKTEKVDEEAMEQMQASLEKYRTAAGGAKPADAPAAPAATASAAGTTGTTEPGFMSLFDGKDITKSFVIKGSAESWKVAEEGILASIPGGDWIVSKEKFGDFTLRLEWRVSKGGNSGVFVRVPSQDDGAPWETGFEIQISNEGRDDAHCTGSLYGVEAVKPRPDETPGIWHSSEITCLGGRITVKSDGVRCIDASYDKSPAMQKRPLEGFIGLQDSHSGPGSTIEYRNIRIRRLEKGLESR